MKAWQPSYTLQEIPDGREGIRTTLKIMSALVKKYKTAPAVRELSVNLINSLNQKNFIGEVAALHKYVRDNIRYVKDVRGVETLQSPIQTLRLKAGDCDDKSSLVAAMLESLGHRTRFIAVGFRPNALSHVFVQTKIRDKWVSVECTEPVPLGWTPKKIKCSMVQHN